MAETQDDSIRFTVALTEPEPEPPEPEPPEPEPEPEPPEKRTVWLLIVAAIILFYLLTRLKS